MVACAARAEGGGEAEVSGGGALIAPEARGGGGGRAAAAEAAAAAAAMPSLPAGTLGGGGGLGAGTVRLLPVRLRWTLLPNPDGVPRTPGMRPPAARSGAARRFTGVLVPQSPPKRMLAAPCAQPSFLARAAPIREILGVSHVHPFARL
jgi:hypothetical protein